MADKKKKFTPAEVQAQREAVEGKTNLPRTNAGPMWENPRTPQPVDAITPKGARQNVLQRAQSIAGLGAAPEVLAAVTFALAVEDLGNKLTEAAAISQYKRGS